MPFPPRTMSIIRRGHPIARREHKADNDHAGNDSTEETLNAMDTLSMVVGQQMRVRNQLVGVDAYLPMLARIVRRAHTE